MTYIYCKNTLNRGLKPLEACIARLNQDIKIRWKEACKYLFSRFRMIKFYSQIEELKSFTKNLNPGFLTRVYLGFKFVGDC